MISIPSINTNLTAIETGIMKDVSTIANDIATVVKYDADLLKKDIKQYDIKRDISTLKSDIKNEIAPHISATVSSNIPKALKRRRNVSFYPKVSIQFCRSHKDYSLTEKRQCWLSFDELKMMKRSSRMLAMEFSDANHNSTNGNKIPMSENGVDCFRGLEGRTALGSAKRKKVKQNSRRAVIREQNSQKNSGIVDEILLADTYYEYTEFSQVEAHMIALRDEAEATLCHSTDSTPTIINPTTTSKAAKFLKIDASKVPSWSSRKISPTNAKKTFSRSSNMPPPPPPLPRKFGFSRSDSLVLSIARGESARRLSSLTGTTRVLTDRFFKV